jgi:hypothetical protein
MTFDPENIVSIPLHPIFRYQGLGYSIFITLNKERLDPAYDYDDELFADRLRWVTRRDRGSDHPDYFAPS